MVSAPVPNDVYATRHRSERYASTSTPTFASGKDYEESADETLNRTYSERKKMGFLDEIEVRTATPA